jgi:nitroimidazol reductase NimA-like FMN-containing flavoprotein (pyridoxamine 5'-phosphate oxidase superfamily)
MPSRRETIRMTPSEVHAYLEEQRKAIVVTNGPDDLPHPVPMHYGLDGEKRILITTFRKSQKVKNLERDPRATLLIESGSLYRELRSVIAYCDAEIVSEPDLVASLMRCIRAEQAMASSLDDSMNAQIRASIAKRVVIRFSAFRTVSWDHSKLGEFY